MLLTVHFVETSLMLAFFRDANTSQSVIDVYNYLDQKLGRELFKKLLPVILTDNGSEFSDPKGIEYGPEKNARLRTQIYYCAAGYPHQKGLIEVNHELIRRVLPKGTSFNHLTQKEITRMMNHINSYKRKKLNNRSPYETFSFCHGEESISLWHAHFSHNTSEKRIIQTAFWLQKWHFIFKTCFLDTKTAFRLQIFYCRLQRMQFDLQSGI